MVDVLTAYNGVSTAANNGRITSLVGKNITYTDVGLISAIGNTSYSYDTSGKRLSKTVNGVTTNFYYAGEKIRYSKIYFFSCYSICGI